ncbi:helix-turn-helix domain-containing protein [Shumkonia mesophila]|uniref:helix-turn-helix domain-containing protein n=1 Tax=Shumkonia mesophila TaxID=2838854 RepID=UPI0029347646|nr:helix-turn-helix domain-containing protein [Shumkonia mesophila]
MKVQNTHAEDVKAMVRKTGVTLAELARRHDLSDSTTRAALYRPQPSGNRVIANYLGKSLNELWPLWFDERGDRIPSKTGTKNIRPAQAGHCQKRVAA